MFRGFWHFILTIIHTITNWQSWKILENSAHMLSFRCLAFVWVICPLEKSKTSSLRSFKIAMLFWHSDSFVLLAPTMSVTKLSQFFGHSRFKIYKKNAKSSYPRLEPIYQIKGYFLQKSEVGYLDSEQENNDWDKAGLSCRLDYRDLNFVGERNSQEKVDSC